MDKRGSFSFMRMKCRKKCKGQNSILYGFCEIGLFNLDDNVWLFVRNWVVPAVEHDFVKALSYVSSIFNGIPQSIV